MPAPAQPFDHLGREVQTCRRRGGRLRGPGRVGGLVPLGVAQVGVDIGRQGRDPGQFDGRIRIVGVEGHGASAAVSCRHADHRRPERRADADDGAWSCQAGGTSQALVLAAPLTGEHEELDIAAAVIDPMEPGSPHPGVVDDQEVASTQQRRQLSKLPVFEATIRAAHGAAATRRVRPGAPARSAPRGSE